MHGVTRRERARRLEHARVLGDDVARARLVGDLLRRRVAKRRHPQPRRDRLAGRAPVAVRAVGQPRESPSGRPGRRGRRNRDRLDLEAAAVDQERVVAPAGERGELVHDPARHAGRDLLRLLAGQRELEQRQLEAGGVAEREREGDLERRARREAGAERHRRGDDASIPRRPARAPPASDDAGRVAAPARLDLGRLGAAVGGSSTRRRRSERAARRRRRSAAPGRRTRGRAPPAARSPRCSPCGRRSG